MLFGNNMSWLYGKIKKKLDAPATAGSAGDVLTLGESGKPEWSEGGGGGALPEVTSVDEGKILTVIDNEGTYEWGAAEPAGGDSPLMMYITSFNRMETNPDNTGNTYYYYNTNITLDDLGAAYTYNTFKPVFVCVPIYIGSSASGPNFYEYSGYVNTVLPWPHGGYEYEYEGSIVSIYVDQNGDVLIRLAEQSLG